ncbi:MAG TPA: hypothetical protein PLW35_10415 [Verrucomicrobiota bacterium]|nr:hypothetical protein [Verrucomicrobiota bacterium]HOK78119.1 hypothetical protein [Verrucomicrobiota bacterium]
MRTTKTTRATVICMVLSGCVALTACKRASDEPRLETKNPKVAASQLEQAFASAPSDVAEQAKAAAQAMQAGEYERAITSLEAVRGQENLTLEQGMAVHSSVVSMEAKLIQAIQAGDPNAKRAYELLKALKRN